MLKYIRKHFPCVKDGDPDQIKADLAREKQHSADLESALVELAELYAEQDDAIVELAGMIEEV